MYALKRTFIFPKRKVHISTKLFLKGVLQGTVTDRYFEVLNK